ncbi:MAG: response regulator transcription factor [Terriglobales bacterium]|nr:response regulator transcription factor [Terriglobales bacterium]
MLRILIVDDSTHVRRALRTCLELTPNWEVCGEAENGQDGIDMVRASKPDVVLLDYAMPGMNGLEAARQIAMDAPDSVMLLFTMFASEQLSELAQSVGVRKVISKAVGGVGAIVQAIQDAASGVQFPGSEGFQAPGEIAS